MWEEGSDSPCVENVCVLAFQQADFQQSVDCKVNGVQIDVAEANAGFQNSDARLLNLFYDLIDRLCLFARPVARLFAIEGHCAGDVCGV